MTGPARSRNGCFRCRTRKIKCDETHPQCERCQNAGYNCPGYKSANDVVFRSMNKTVENKVAWKQGNITTPHAKSSKSQKSVARTSRDSVSSNEDSHDSPQEGVSEVAANSVVAFQHTSSTLFKVEAVHPLCAPMTTHWQDPALCRFFSDYVLEASDVKASFGFLDHLPQLYGERPDDILATAVSAVSLASFSTQVRSEELLSSARRMYGKTLHLLKKGLTTPSRVTSDGTLAGVLFCNMFEMISGDKPFVNHWGNTHADALEMLLSLRGNVEQFTDMGTGGLSRAAHGVVIFKNLLQRKPPGYASQLWLDHLPKNEHWAKTCPAILNITRLLPMADSLLAEDITLNPSGESLLELIAEFKNENHRFEDWAIAAQYPYTYGFLDREILLSDNRNDPNVPLPPTVHYYGDSWIGGIWNVYRIARIFLLQTLIKLTERVSAYPALGSKTLAMEDLRTECLINISDTCDDLFASIPFVLGKVDDHGWSPRVTDQVKGPPAISAYTSTFPLRLILMMVPTLNIQQRTFIVQQLNYIRNSMGIKSAQPPQF